jgi:hypothetical protein
MATPETDPYANEPDGMRTEPRLIDASLSGGHGVATSPPSTVQVPSAAMGGQGSPPVNRTLLFSGVLANNADGSPTGYGGNSGATGSGSSGSGDSGGSGGSGSASGGSGGAFGCGVPPANRDMGATTVDDVRAQWPSLVRDLGPSRARRARGTSGTVWSLSTHSISVATGAVTAVVCILEPFTIIPS